MALYKILQDKNYDVGSLVTTVNKKFYSVSMHGIHEKLLEDQAKSIGLPLYKIYFTEAVSMAEYGDVMKKSLGNLVEEKCEYAIFGRP